MKKLMLKIYPLFLLLFLFSCVKDREFFPDQIQARTGHDDPCSEPCQRPDFVQVLDIEGCSAVFTWGYNEPVCGTFIVRLHNLATGAYTYYDPATSPFTLEDLTPCTQYTVGVSHLTDSCASKPLELSFQTDCKKCKSCDIPCQPLDYSLVNNITTDGATVHFGFDSPTCGYFIARLKNNATGTYTSYDPVESPLVLSDLEPCTEYTISIAHVTDQCAYLPTSIDFTTDCEEYCPAAGDDPSCLYVQGLLLGDGPGAGGWLFTDDSGPGYIDATDQEIYIEPGTVVAGGAGSCYCLDIEMTLYLKIWIDYNQNFEFEASELVVDFSFYNNGNGPSSINCPNFILPPFTFPNVEVCGFTARHVLSNEPDTGPCDDFEVGQVIDFTINSLEGC